jgi:hypothetical protein
MSRQTSLLDCSWILVKDGNDTGRDLMDAHYSRRHYWDGRQNRLFVGPGEKMVLLFPDAQSLFVWRKFISLDSQAGVNCAVFRNEGPTKSSELIRQAVELARERWPNERFYTYVNPRKIRHKRDPGRCFLKAGWRHYGWSKRGLRILELIPEAA